MYFGYIDYKMAQTKEELAEYQRKQRKKYSKDPVWTQKQAEKS